MANPGTGIREGVCKNLPTNCVKAAAKELQRAAATRFVCEECGGELRGQVKAGNAALSRGVVLAAGVSMGLLLLVGGVWELFMARDAVCPAESLDDFLERKPSPAESLEAASACRDAIGSAADDPLIAAVARLCRLAADGGSPEGFSCLGELYDPKEIRPGRLGQMPTPDPELSKDLYGRAARLRGVGANDGVLDPTHAGSK